MGRRERALLSHFACRKGGGFSIFPSLWFIRSFILLKINQLPSLLGLKPSNGFPLPFGKKNPGPLPCLAGSSLIWSSLSAQLHFAQCWLCSGSLMRLSSLPPLSLCPCHVFTCCLHPIPQRDLPDYSVAHYGFTVLQCSIYTCLTFLIYWLAVHLIGIETSRQKGLFYLPRCPTWHMADTQQKLVLTTNLSFRIKEWFSWKGPGMVYANSLLLIDEVAFDSLMTGSAPKWGDLRNIMSFAINLWFYQAVPLPALSAVYFQDPYLSNG